MNNMKPQPKINIEITPKGWVITYTHGRFTRTEEWIRNVSGSTRIKGSFTTEKGIPEAFRHSCFDMDPQEISMELEDVEQGI